MASRTKSAPNKDDDAPLIDLNEASIKKLMTMAKKKGYVTLDELNEALPTDMDSEKIEDVQNALSEMGVQIVESDEDAEAEAEQEAEVAEMQVDEGKKDAKKPTAAAAAKKTKTGDRTDEPVRM